MFVSVCVCIRLLVFAFTAALAYVGVCMHASVSACMRLRLSAYRTLIIQTCSDANGSQCLDMSFVQGLSIYDMGDKVLAHSCTRVNSDY